MLNLKVHPPRYLSDICRDVLIRHYYIQKYVQMYWSIICFVPIFFLLASTPFQPHRTFSTFPPFRRAAITLGYVPTFIRTGIFIVAIGTRQLLLCRPCFIRSNLKTAFVSSCFYQAKMLSEKRSTRLRLTEKWPLEQKYSSSSSNVLKTICALLASAHAALYPSE